MAPQQDNDNLQGLRKDDPLDAADVKPDDVPCNCQGDDDKDTLLEQRQREVEEYKHRWLRVQADFDNYRKRTQREIEDIHRYAAEALAKDLLPVMDNFERALSCVEDENDPIYKGVYLIYQQLKNLLGEYCIREIEALGQPFDPNYHDAAMMIESDDHDEGTVVEVLQKGYLYHSKVIRPSMVKVSKNK